MPNHGLQSECYSAFYLFHIDQRPRTQESLCEKIVFGKKLIGARNCIALWRKIIPQRYSDDGDGDEDVGGRINGRVIQYLELIPLIIRTRIADPIRHFRNRNTRSISKFHNEEIFSVVNFHFLAIRPNGFPFPLHTKTPPSRAATSRGRQAGSGGTCNPFVNLWTHAPPRNASAIGILYNLKYISVN